MLVNLNCNNSGQECWNTGAINNYTEAINVLEDRYGAMECYEVKVIGKVACNGCGSAGACGADLSESTLLLRPANKPESERPIRLDGLSPTILADDMPGLIAGFKRHSPNRGVAARIGGVIGSIVSAVTQFPKQTIIP